MGLTALASSTQPLMLAMMIVGQLVDRLMKGATEAVGKGNSIRPVLLLLVDLAKPLLKLSIGLVEALILDSCRDKELLAKQFILNWNCRYMAVTILEKGGWSLLQVRQMKVAAQKALQVLIYTWIPHGPDLDSLIF